ncbi:polyprenyl synthetase family protein [Aspergillus clavatus NRRL 1]|uniref:Geranylgeranyl diphosphate synthase, putative n=1 Tax=Aspergillus clavatus (strain ATCC 1007 / CBS 513.65 / DSM 816 / NCTC 3887 / NRRL 1 / QM 1276 / 107) TaxID=344612 RepID=A1CE13_ASPCL|nr:Geranylgeranyl diphosphate synthase, putative [Aspergillus clavatus NRRL 1]EAW12090.1 Geranylgeranyl diphosphate synthase, putative [Aspergillus clavatus NRRL 1]
MKVPPSMLEEEPLSIIILLLPAFFYYLISNIIDRLPVFQIWSKKSYLIGLKDPERITSFECPYSYIRKIYGRHHWAPFIEKLSPGLKEDDPGKYEIVNEIMDAIHLCLILVDDISDGSDYRKGHTAAHRIYGPSETANRAYYRVTQLLRKTTVEFPQLAPWLMQDLEDILAGQDLSLVWRRDGLSSFPNHAPERDAAYRRMASLKTGALFQLLGHLVLEDSSMDKTMTQIAWYSQLQNDCKNVYSSEYAKLKGALAEDLSNRELTYPIVLALNAADGNYVTDALEYPSRRNLRRALKVIQSEEVHSLCAAELQAAGKGIEEWLRLWGRKEKMDL